MSVRDKSSLPESLEKYLRRRVRHMSLPNPLPSLWSVEEEGERRRRRNSEQSRRDENTGSHCRPPGREGGREGGRKGERGESVHHWLVRQL